MYEVQLAGIDRPARVDAETIEIYDDVSYIAPSVRLIKDGKIVFFAPFDSIISVQKYESTGTQTNGI